MTPRMRGIFSLLFLLFVGVTLAALLWFGPDAGLPVPDLLRRDQTWQAMQQRGTWRVGLDPSFPPFEQLDGQGRPVGFDVDLANALAQRWGLDAEIVAIGFDSLPDALKAARIDSIVSAYPYDERLTRDVTFSEPYFDAGLRLAVRRDSTVATAKDLAGQRVAVEWGSLGDMVGRRLQREGVDLELVPFETPAETVQALAHDDTIGAALVDQVTLRQLQGQGLPVVAVGPPLESSPYVVVAPLRARELQERLAAALTALREEGVLAALEEKWFGVHGD
jgi:ABC-type amino acid transport substrate-binding protein